MSISTLPIDVQIALDDQTLEERAIKVTYKNWQGKVTDRTILPMGEAYLGSTKHHPKEQWLLGVWDVEKSDYRTYAIKDIMWKANQLTPN